MSKNRYDKFIDNVNSMMTIEKEHIMKHFNEFRKEIYENFSFKKFSFDLPYDGKLNNKIFLVYSNAYKNNSPYSMQISSLSNPHLEYEDRGYIKGVAIDLDGYLLIRKIKNYKTFLFERIWWELDYPQKKHEKYLNYVKECARPHIQAYIDIQKNEMAEIFKYYTDLENIFNYIEDQI